MTEHSEKLRNSSQYLTAWCLMCIFTLLSRRAGFLYETPAAFLRKQDAGGNLPFR